MGALPHRRRESKMFPGSEEGSWWSALSPLHQKYYFQRIWEIIHVNMPENMSCQQTRKEITLFYKRCNQSGISLANSKLLRRVTRNVSRYETTSAARRCREQQHLLQASNLNASFLSQQFEFWIRYIISPNNTAIEKDASKEHAT